MDRGTRHFVKLPRLAVEDLVRQPAKKHNRADCGRQAEQ